MESSRGPCAPAAMGALPVDGEFLIGLIEKSSGSHHLIADPDRFEAPAAGIHKESAAAVQSVAPQGGIDGSDLHGIEASEPVFIRERDTDPAPVLLLIQDEPAGFGAAKYSGYDDAVFHHGNARFHTVCGFYLEILAHFCLPA